MHISGDVQKITQILWATAALMPLVALLLLVAAYLWAIRPQQSPAQLRAGTQNAQNHTK